MNCQWQSLLCQVEAGVLNMFGEEEEVKRERSPQYTIQLRGCEVKPGPDTAYSYRITLSMLDDQVAVLEVSWWIRKWELIQFTLLFINVSFLPAGEQFWGKAVVAEASAGRCCILQSPWQQKTGAHRCYPQVRESVSINNMNLFLTMKNKNCTRTSCFPKNNNNPYLI